MKDEGQRFVKEVIFQHRLFQHPRYPDLIAFVKAVLFPSLLSRSTTWKISSHHQPVNYFTLGTIQWTQTA